MAELVDAVDLKSIEGNLRESSSLSVAILGSRQVWLKALGFELRIGGSNPSCPIKPFFKNHIAGKAIS